MSFRPGFTTFRLSGVYTVSTSPINLSIWLFTISHPTVNFAYVFPLAGMVSSTFSRYPKTNRKIFFILVAILIIYIIFISPWCLIPILQLTLQWPAYIDYLAIIFSQIDFLPAIFVIMGMGLAYTR